MGRVYLAEQDHPVRRRVALKIVKAGMDSRQVLARFEAERQALALMDPRTFLHGARKHKLIEQNAFAEVKISTATVRYVAG